MHSQLTRQGSEYFIRKILFISVARPGRELKTNIEFHRFFQWLEGRMRRTSARNGIYAAFYLEMLPVVSLRCTFLCVAFHMFWSLFCDPKPALIWDEQRQVTIFLIKYLDSSSIVAPRLRPGHRENTWSVSNQIVKNRDILSKRCALLENCNGERERESVCVCVC